MSNLITTLQEYYVARQQYFYLYGNLVFFVIYFAIFIWFRIIGDTIGPLTIFFMDMAILHLFLIYLEKNARSSMLLLFLVYAAHICADVLMIIMIVSLFLFEGTFKNEWKEEQIVGELHTLEVFFNLKFLFLIIFLVCAAYYTFKVIIIKNKKDSFNYTPVEQYDKSNSNYLDEVFFPQEEKDHIELVEKDKPIQV